MARESNVYSPAAVAALNQLEKTAEFIEFQRFEKNLSAAVASTQATGTQKHATSLSTTVTDALKEANERLQSEGQFDPKMAADLIRAAMEDANRGFVAELESRTGAMPYTGADKDGA